ncbi:polysaccharide deacetylase family protein [Pelosinus propionicus]|uniref:Peptidoglycan/xylan/chitin deacetylase, PgdA/CDA1 family n=1 Tax=Pelosinus propionicus DSM 13327 TaxID=1123291 RepID=A0A1I4M7E7_9FIRM|nr:polysaccharide deacetylase family protein [Pelosinus propionicus]SFL99129.1 Peptidoglycan/xylan/chitin deacetylase, PgdA/CDA1 family [Pelosinus propionicus DSM 13327]
MNKQKRLLICFLLSIIFLVTSCTPAKKPETQVNPEMRQETIPADMDKYKRGHNIPGKLYWAGSAQDKKIALTFDDGPENEWTPKILAILKEQQVKATFFVIGRQAQAYPEMVRKIDENGHIIGNHTFDHADLTKLNAPSVKNEIAECALVINRIIGKTPALVRPPFGFHNEIADTAIYSRNNKIILWSLDTDDWQGPNAATIKERVIPKVKNGYIILQHNGVNPHLGGSVEALPVIIEELKKQGYTFVTIAELLEVQPYE